MTPGGYAHRYSPDGTHVASAEHRCRGSERVAQTRVRLWDVGTGQLRMESTWQDGGWSRKDLIKPHDPKLTRWELPAAADVWLLRLQRGVHLELMVSHRPFPRCCLGHH